MCVLHRLHRRLRLRHCPLSLLMAKALLARGRAFPRCSNSTHHRHLGFERSLPVSSLFLMGWKEYAPPALPLFALILDTLGNCSCSLPNLTRTHARCPAAQPHTHSHTLSKAQTKSPKTLALCLIASFRRWLRTNSAFATTNLSCVCRAKSCCCRCCSAQVTHSTARVLFTTSNPER